MNLTRSDVVRARIVADIVTAYERSAEKQPETTATAGAVAADVFVADEQSERAVDVEHMATLARQVLVAEGVRDDIEVSLLFVDEPTIAELHERFLGKKGPTDVLAFPIDEEPDRGGRSPDEGGPGPGGGLPSEEDGWPVLLGDVVVCPTVAARNAVDHGVEFEDEVALLVVHGLLAPRRHGPPRRRRRRADGSARTGPAGPLSSGGAMSVMGAVLPVIMAKTSPFRAADGILIAVVVVLLGGVGRARHWPRRAWCARAGPRRCRSRTTAGAALASSCAWCRTRRDFLNPVLLLVLICQLVDRHLGGDPGRPALRCTGCSGGDGVRGGRDLRAGRSHPEELGRAQPGALRPFGRARRLGGGALRSDTDLVERADRAGQPSGGDRAAGITA